MLRKAIISVIDLFYPPFKRFMPIHTFRYAACGGFNVFIDIFLYFLFYNFLLDKQVLQLGFIAFKPHIAAFLLSFLITFPVGFLLSRFIVWTDSLVLWHVQLFRYFVVVLINLFLNYIFIKILVEYFKIYPTIAKLITTVIVIIFSYLTQKHFTFKVKHAKKATV
ncbi:MAG: GtrA family protein [Ferruginibacter sp.]